MRIKSGLFIVSILLFTSSGIWAQSSGAPNFVDLALNNNDLVIAYPDNNLSPAEKMAWMQYGNDIRLSFCQGAKVKPARELTTDDLAKNSVVFLGNAIINSKIIGFMNSLPEATVEENKLSFGGREFLGKNVFLLAGGPSVQEKRFFLFGLSSGKLPQIPAESLQAAMKYDFLVGDHYGTMAFGVFDFPEGKIQLDWKAATILSRPQVKSRSTNHYEFFFPANSLAERDMPKLEKFQEECYRKTCIKYGFKKPLKVSFILYSSPDERKRFTSHSGNGNADQILPRVFILYTDDTKCIGSHELAHVLSRENWSREYPGGFLDEGVAELPDGTWNGKPHREIARELLQNGKLPRISDLEADWGSVSDEVSYPVSAVFVSFALEKHGLTNLRKMYVSLAQNPGESVESFLKVTPEKLQMDFEAWLRK